MEQQTDIDSHDMAAVMKRLYDLGFISLMVEGGARTLTAVADSGLWDEARGEISREARPRRAVSHAYSRWSAETLRNDRRQYHRGICEAVCRTGVITCAVGVRPCVRLRILTMKVAELMKNVVNFAR